ncbi:MAG: hypothetical protein JST95_00235 [Bacteroidetes bacterium]|nr:hypothetical protein [Bacteroidota bacterium]
MIFNKRFLRFLLVFLGCFFFLYLGTVAWIGIAAPGKLYSPFVEKHLDYVSWIKHSLMAGTKFFLGIFGYDVISQPDFRVRIAGGKAVLIAMDCVGYGVYSFWIAYIVANPGRWIFKLSWILGGVLLLWFINVVRISLFLLAYNKGWPMPLGINHHTWFNIFAYVAIFCMMYFVEKKSKIFQSGNHAG